MTWPKMCCRNTQKNDREEDTLAKPECRGCGSTRFRVIARCIMTRDKPDQCSTQAQIEQAHVGGDRHDQCPNTVGNHAEMMNDEWRQEKRHHKTDRKGGPIGKNPTRCACT